MLVTRHYGDGHVTPSAWFAANCWHALVLPSQMLLFALSGAVVLGRSEAASHFYKTRFARLVFAWLFWSAFYFGWRTLFRGEHLDWQASAWGLLHGDSKVAMYHMWYINHLLKLYSLTPLFNAVFRDPDPTVLRLLLLLSFMVYAYQILAQHLRLKIFLFEWLSFLGFRTSLYLLGPTLRLLRTRRAVVGGCGFVFVGSMMNALLSTTSLVEETGRMDESFYHELQTLFMMSLSAFVLLKALGELPVITESDRAGQFFNKCAEHSFALYMLHPAVLDILRPILVRPDFTLTLGHPVIGIPLSCIVLIFATFCASVVLKHLPVVRAVGGFGL
eukprot:TRINITY_DN2815_c0_g1_i1.p1 TRINITY_DN2815_c0_g1~~TRINITY_DN2815_c0_g1_i1.p1  ORF type:complete len:331 (-),score=15.11 TRINITY_DN2815_c0_g1_i1:130-1122(-)